MVVVVLPTPPFWLHIATTRARVGPLTGRGSGNVGIGRPVGPSGTSASGLGPALGRGLGPGLGAREGKGVAHGMTVLGGRCWNGRSHERGHL